MDWKDELFKFMDSLHPGTNMYDYVNYIQLCFGLKEAGDPHFDPREPILCVYIACSKMSIQSPVFESIPEHYREEMINWVLTKASQRVDWQKDTHTLQMMHVADGYFLQENHRLRKNIPYLDRMLKLPAQEK